MPPNILVLEDEPVIAAMLDELIGSWGVVVHIARNLGEARGALSVLTFDAALVDYSLGGGERASEIADVLIERGTPFAFVTGYDHDAPEPRHASLLCSASRSPRRNSTLCCLSSSDLLRIASSRLTACAAQVHGPVLGLTARF